MTAIVLRKCALADLSQARWFSRQVGPSIDACRFRAEPPAVELRTMREDGLARRSGDVCLSTRSIFWSQLQICATLLHEFAHRIVFDWEHKTVSDAEPHGLLFLLVLLALYTRVDLSGALRQTLANQVSLYDFQDTPACFSGLSEDRWRGLVLAWAIEHCDALARSPAAAEDLPAAAAERWAMLLKRCSDWEDEQVRVENNIAALQQENQRLRGVVSMTKFVSLGVGVGVALLCIFALAVVF